MFIKLLASRFPTSRKCRPSYIREGCRDVTIERQMSFVDTNWKYAGLHLR